MNRPTLLVIAGAVVVITAIILNFTLLDGDDPAPSGREVPQAVKRTAPTRSPAPVSKPAAPPAGTTQPPATRPPAAQPAASKPQIAQPPAAQPPVAQPKATTKVKGPEKKPEVPAKKPASKPVEQAPSFDVVRINADGDTVMAGRGKPGSRILILDGGRKIGEVTADGRGEWVFIPTSPLASGNRKLSLTMILNDGSERRSASEVMLMVPKRGRDLAGRPAEKPSQPLVMKLDRKSGKTQEILQKPAPQATPQATPAKLLVDAVDYDEAGRLNIIGHGPAGSRVRIYLDNHFLGEVRSESTGTWRLTPPNLVAPGVYKLRADRVDEAGKVQARAEIVFARSVPLTGVRPGTLVVIEPGNSLWRIAQRTYGSGFRYTVIYEANKAQIGDADLIYPGQVFKLPSVN